MPVFLQRHDHPQQRGDYAPAAQPTSCGSPTYYPTRTLITRGTKNGGIPTPELQSGIWTEDGQGQMTLVARTGGTLEVAPNDFRVVSRLGFAPGSGNSGGHRSGFDDLGGLAFTADFTDGTSGMFAYRPVPEPNLLTMVSLALAGLFGM
jgi:hypothetical protein